MRICICAVSKMAEASISVFQDQFSCSICLDLLKDPVTINCGHSYCMSCITDCWDQDDQKRVYSCPQCRHTFTSRPVLGKNTMLTEVVEKLKKIRLQTDPSAPSYAGPGDVECDVCTGRKHRAVKSCLVCLESYCQSHFERHEEFRSGKRHKVTDATGRLQQMICSQHDRLLEVFCRTDQKCICLLCTMDEHKNHDTVSTAAERTEKQKLMEENQMKLQQRIQEKQKELQDLREAVKTHKLSAQAAVEDSERIFTELIRSIERRRSEVTQLIRDQEKTAVTQAEGVLKDLEQEINDLKWRDAEMELISHTEDHICFMQSFQSLSASSGSTESITVSSLLCFDDLGKSVTQLKEKMEDFCKEEIESLSDKVSYIEIIPSSGTKTRTHLLQSWEKTSTLDATFDSFIEKMQQMEKASDDVNISEDMERQEADLQAKILEERKRLKMEQQARLKKRYKKKQQEQRLQVQMDPQCIYRLPEQKKQIQNAIFVEFPE